MAVDSARSLVLISQDTATWDAILVTNLAGGGALTTARQVFGRSDRQKLQRG